MSRNRTLTLLAGALSLALVATACSSSSKTSESGALPPAASGAQSLKGVCPDPIAIQTAWYPEAARSIWYHLLGSNYTIDRNTKRVSGPLIATTGTGPDRKQVDTGVKIQIRAGGPAVGFEQDSALLYLHKDIMAAEVSTDEAIQNAATQPTIAAVTLLELDPLVLMWSADAHPNFTTIVDVGQTDTKVLYFQNNPYMEYLIGSGILRRSQVDGDYDGSPSRWVASGGTIVQQGYATNEPGLYEHELKQWHGKINYQLVNDTGYPNYTRATLAIRAADKQKLAPCLARLVPILQWATIDYMANPQATNQLILTLDKAYKSGLNLTPGLLAYGHDTMQQKGIVDNGTDATVGNFDMTRVQRMISIVNPILTTQKKKTKPDLKPQDIVTNEFIDPHIGFATG